MTMSATPRSSTLYEGLIPDPWDWSQFHAAAEKVLGCPLLLAPTSLSSGNASVWIATTDTDLIVYSRAVDGTERLHAIAYQMAHILLAHQAIASDTNPSLFTHLDPALVASMLTVGRYAPADEQAAEDFASLVVARAQSPQVTATASNAIQRLPASISEIS
jgi:hypothetical protein